jgi:hypothetical protein
MLSRPYIGFCKRLIKDRVEVPEEILLTNINEAK